MRQFSLVGGYQHFGATYCLEVYWDIEIQLLIPVVSVLIVCNHSDRNVGRPGCILEMVTNGKIALLPRMELCSLSSKQTAPSRVLL